MTQLNLYLLGAPNIEVDGQSVGTDRRKAVALLAYLALAGGAHSRDALATLLWPESDQSRALAYLRRTIWEIKSMVGEGWLAVSRDQVSCAPDRPLWLDVTAFTLGTTAVDDPEKLAEAVALYRDDFMAGFTLRDAPGFDQWQFFQVEHWRRELAMTLHDLSHALAAQGQPQAAVPFARRWLALDPLNEPAHRQLMALFDQMGERVAALRQYEACRAGLASELGIPPEPETTALYENIRQGASRDAAAIRPVDAHSTPTARPRLKLVASLATTSFVGRQSELNEIVAALKNPDVRLLSLIGPGGSGKTRLALQAAGEMDPVFADGVYFVSLAQLPGFDSLVPAIAKQVGLGFVQENETPHDQLLAYLHSKRLLLVLDNFEHLIAGGGVNLVDELLGAAPQLTVLATSRMRLGLQSEHQYPVAGLRMPDRATAVGWLENDQAIQAQIAPYSALRLFDERARQLLPTFALAKETLMPALGICHLVAGLPLAIELAVSWLDTLTVAEIEAEIEASIDFLETEAPDVPDRQRSMRAVFNYSWQLLTDAEQDVFPKLTIFQGDFSRQAAQRIAGASLLIVKSLVNKSLLKRERDGRFTIHELLLQYAAEKLRDNPDGWHAARDRHSAYFLDSLEREGRRMGSPRQRAAFDAIEQEIENMRSAWLWAMVQRRYELVLPTIPALVYYYLVRSTLNPGLSDLIDMVLADLEAVAIADPVTPGRPTAAQQLFASLLAVQSWVLGYTASAQLEHLSGRALELIDTWQIADRIGLAHLLAATIHARFVNERDGIAHGKQALAALRGRSPSWELALGLNMIGALLHSAGVREGVHEILEEGVALSRQLGDDLALAYNLTTLAWVLTDAREFDRALQIDQECQPLFEAVGDRAGAAYNLWNIASIYDVSGQYEKAAQHYQESRHLFAELGRRADVATSLGWESQMQQRLGDYETALSLRQQAFDQFSIAAQAHGIAWSLFELGEIYQRLGDVKQAQQLHRQSFAHFTRLQLDHGLIFYHRVQGRGKLDAGDLVGARAALDASLALSGENSSDYWNRALTLCELAHVALTENDPVLADNHFKEALLLADRWGSLGAIMVILTGYAHLWTYRKQFESAAALAALVLAHAATWAETKPMAENVLAAAAQQLTTAAFQEAQATGRKRALDDVVAEIVADSDKTVQPDAP